MAPDFRPVMGRRDLLRFGGYGLATAALLGTGASLAGCAPNSGGGGSNTGTLTMLYFGDQKAATTLQDALQPNVKKIDKDLTLKVTAINGTDWNDFLAKVLTLIASGQAPDIVSVATEGLQLMAGKDLIVPLDDYVTKDMSTLKSSYFNDIHPALVEAMMVNGHLYNMPDSFNAGSMFFNNDVLQKAGASAPAAGWTMNDFHNTAEKVKAVGGDILPFDWVVRLWGSWTSFLYANGGNLLEEGKYDGGDWLWGKAYDAGNPAIAGRKGGWKWGAPTANSAASVEALQYVIDLQKGGYSPSPDVGGGSTLQGLFASGRVGMTIGGGFWAGGLHNAGMKDGSFDVQAFPTWKTKKSLFGTGGYSIFKSSQKKDAAWEVVKMMIKPESFDIMFPGNVTTSGRKSLMTADRYKTTGPKNWSVFYDQLDGSVPISAPSYYNALATSLNQRTTEAISSGNAKAALDSMQSDLEKAAKGS
ncbi:ABC transporter substrate-binding protein [Psychromicrobium xiongbiense]|uniref:ABC transporter substrate-binding protein n=1 Tax=Psychromicrobium xiongbiense TaxID=3051184 RepID=UPI00255476AD|nr:sugar ABC transporter substrate-binding protein [Psychromicrobium sp. YIM S02556]